MSSRNAVVVRAVRIPFAKSFTSYRTQDSTDLATQCVGQLMSRVPSRDLELDELIMGCVAGPAGGVNIARDVVLRLGLSPNIPGIAMSRACASSLTGLAMAADGIAAGSYRAVVVGGVEALSTSPVPYSKRGIEVFAELTRTRSFPGKLRALMKLRPSMLLPAVPRPVEPTTGLTMGDHCEKMAKEWGVTREEQDQLAFDSHRKAAAAEGGSGLPGVVAPGFGGKGLEEAVEQDNGIRRPPDPNALKTLKPAFDKVHGTLTAGNSTFLTDGAAAMLVMEEEYAKSLGLHQGVRIVAHQVRSIDPAEGLLMAPPLAIARLLGRVGMRLQDFATYEIHEAFAAQVLCNLKAMESDRYCREKLGLPEMLGSIDAEKMNVKGGSLAIGHPFAATGVRLIMGLMDALKGKPGARGLASACAAGAQGQAVVVEGIGS